MTDHSAPTRGELPEGCPTCGALPCDWAAGTLNAAPIGVAANLRDEMISVARRVITDRYYAGGKVRQMTAVKPRELAELVLDAVSPLIAAHRLAAIEECAKVAEDDDLILSDSRRPGSFGKCRKDHGELIASLIRNLGRGV